MLIVSVIVLYVLVVRNELRTYELLYLLEKKKLTEEAEWTVIDAKTFSSTDQVSQPGSAKILVLGDCMALSTGATESQNRLHNIMRTAYSGQVRVNCFGVIGGGVHDLVRMQDSWSQHADVVVLFVGPNDVKRFRVNSFRNTLGELFSLISKNTRAKKIVWVMGDVSSVPAVPYVLRPLAVAVQYLFERIARNVAGVHSIELVHVMYKSESDPFWTNPETFYAPDMFHPSDVGYAYIFEQIRAKIDEVLLEGRPE